MKTKKDREKYRDLEVIYKTPSKPNTNNHIVSCGVCGIRIYNDTCYQFLDNYRFCQECIEGVRANEQ